MAEPGRPKAPLVLTFDARHRLSAWVRDTPEGSKSLALRCRIVLQCADGYSNREVARHLQVSEGTVATWRSRYLEGGLEALRDRPRPGLPRSITDDQVQAVISRTLTEGPPAGTSWTRPSMAQVSGISASSVGRIWREYGLQPRRANIVQLSADPGFVDQVRDVVGLWLQPSEGAFVLCVDETFPIPAARRASPFRSRPEGAGDDDVSATAPSDLHRALAAAGQLVASDPTLASRIERDRQPAFLKFLERIDTAVPADLDLHVVMTHGATTMSESLQDWRLERRLVELHPVPTYAWWIALVEGWVAGFTARGFGRSPRELAAVINTWLGQWHEHPRPFDWHKSEGEIISMLFPPDA